VRSSTGKSDLVGPLIEESGHQDALSRNATALPQRCARFLHTLEEKSDRHRRGFAKLIENTGANTFRPFLAFLHQRVERPSLCISALPLESRFDPAFGRKCTKRKRQAVLATTCRLPWGTRFGCFTGGWQPPRAGDQPRQVNVFSWDERARPRSASKDSLPPGISHD
jgi:hypothetical protein